MTRRPSESSVRRRVRAKVATAIGHAPAGRMVVVVARGLLVVVVVRRRGTVDVVVLVVVVVLVAANSSRSTYPCAVEREPREVFVSTRSRSTLERSASINPVWRSTVGFHPRTPPGTPLKITTSSPDTPTKYEPRAYQPSAAVAAPTMSSSGSTTRSTPRTARRRE